MDVKEPYKPVFRVLANSQDITDTIAKYFKSMSFTDSVGITSDMLEIVLADTDWDKPLAIPPKGSQLEILLGYGSELTNMGMFVRDEVEIAGWPGEMIIRARAAIYDATPQGKTDLQSQKTRSWPKGTKLADMAAKIASEHGMKPLVADKLRAIVLPHMSQSEESDLNFLIRILTKYDAVVKPQAGFLILAKRGEAKSVSGVTLPGVTITPDMCSRFRYVEAARETAGTVVAYWHATKQSRRYPIKVGKGEPVRRLKMYYPTEEMALAAARAELSRRERHQTTVSLACVGDTDIQAEGNVSLEKWRPGVDGEWIVTRVVHTVDSQRGYQCDVELELPNEAGTPEVSLEDDGEG